jgi:hypothetical protein
MHIYCSVPLHVGVLSGMEIVLSYHGYTETVGHANCNYKWEELTPLLQTVTGNQRTTIYSENYIYNGSRNVGNNFKSQAGQASAEDEQLNIILISQR